MQQSKLCPRCLVEKAPSDFYRMAASRDGLARRCKNCSKSAAKEWDLRNPERRHGIDRSRRERKVAAIGIISYRKEVAAKVMKWAKSHPEKVAEKGRSRVLALPDKYIAYHHFGAPLALVPEDFLEMKRAQLQQKRLVKELDEVINETIKGEMK